MASSKKPEICFIKKTMIFSEPANPVRKAGKGKTWKERMMRDPKSESSLENGLRKKAEPSRE
jgi:hypothetical protein